MIQVLIWQTSQHDRASPRTSHEAYCGMPGLQDLASLLGMPEKATADDTAKTPKRLGYDGQVLRLRVRTEKRRGKAITIAWGFSSHPKELDRLLSLLKKSLGAGGQVVDQSIEMQGDHVQRVKDLLIAEGYRVG